VPSDDDEMGSKITNNERYKRETKSRTAMPKVTVQQKEDSFHQQTGLKL
jgi:hypothetical protein